MQTVDGDRHSLRWAHFRFSVVGPLLAAPCAHGELQIELERLSSKTWKHPVTGVPMSLSFATIERWYYQARRNRNDPVEALKRRIRSDAGCRRQVSQLLLSALSAQHQEHRRWSYKLHYDNLVVLVKREPRLGPMPSYSTLRRTMRGLGLTQQRHVRNPRDTEGARQARERLQTLEVRSFEAEYVNGLWHLDFHHGSRSVLLPEARWARPMLLGVIDDHSRLVCHLQWYLEETAEVLVHGLSQAFQKRGLPRALMTDNGAAMVAAETRRGLLVLGILHETTLPYSPYQNAKQESFWGQIEGRLLPMLEGEKELTLEFLNEATQAWVEMEYNRTVHSETGRTPLVRFLEGKTVGRDCPDSAALRRAFRAEATRKQRKSDGTISLGGRRYEIPSRYRHFEKVSVAYASWDRATLDLLDARHGRFLGLLYPLDKQANASGERKHLESHADALAVTCDAQPTGPAPLLADLMTRYRARGLPPAYVPKTTVLRQRREAKTPDAIPSSLTKGDSTP